MPYQIYIGHNQAGNLADAVPQPRSEGTFTRLPDIYAGDGTVYEDGPLSAEWLFTMMTDTEYTTFLTQSGLSAAKSALVTIRTIGANSRTFANYNAVIVRPGRLRYQYWYSNVTFELNHLEAL